MTEQDERRVVAWASVSIDGFTSGPGGAAEDQWLTDHAGQEQTAVYFEGIWRGADTALLGRKNYEGFYSVWPAITRDPAMPARTRDLGAWIDDVEKVVFSQADRCGTAERAWTGAARSLRPMITPAGCGGLLLPGCSACSRPKAAGRGSGTGSGTVDFQAEERSD